MAESGRSSGVAAGLDGLRRQGAGDQAQPPVANQPNCGDIDIRIARDGIWYHEGTPIGRPELVRLFSTILKKEPDGFHLVTPVEKMRIKVEDAPFIAVLLRSEGEGAARRLIFTTNVGDEVTAGPDNPIRVDADAQTGEPSPYVHVRAGLQAKIARPVFYQLVEMAECGCDNVLAVSSGGMRFVLGQA